MRLSSSVKAALAIVAATAGYFAVRAGLRLSDSEEPAAAAPASLSVLVLDVEPLQRNGTLSLRGRTEADQKIVVRADASGVVTETPVALGARVSKGDVLCRLDVEARDAANREAVAARRKAEIDYQAGVKLTAEGFRSEAGLAGLKAALDQAHASADRAGIELEKTNIRAPFDGVFDARAADVGDLLKPGDACGTVVKSSPFLVTGAVAERDVALVRTGDHADARLATGETIEGVVRFVASASDPGTRTFRVEIEVPNENGNLRDGVTADVTVHGKVRDAHKVPRSALTLDDDGRLGVKLVSNEKLVSFEPISIVSEDSNGVWIAGLNGPARIIVRGQEYVKAGETVSVENKGPAL